MWEGFIVKPYYFIVDAAYHRCGANWLRYGGWRAGVLYAGGGLYSVPEAVRCIPALLCRCPRRSRRYPNIMRKMRPKTALSDIHSIILPCAIGYKGEFWVSKNKKPPKLGAFCQSEYCVTYTDVSFAVSASLHASTSSGVSLSMAAAS